MEVSDLIEVITSASITTIVTIMTIALPLIVTAIHKLAEIYKTNYVVYLFNKDKVIIWFRIIMVISILATINWIVVFFVGCCCVLYYSSIVLCIVTLTLLINLIILVARVVYYSLPGKFIKIITNKIEGCKVPERYFDRSVYKPILNDQDRENDRMKLLKEIDAFDEELTFYFVILTHIFVTTDEELVRDEVKKYWEELCRKASKQYKNFNYYVNSYYNFIHKLEDLGIENKDISLQKEAILFTNIMLKAHLPEPRKYGEPEKRIDERKYISAETRESLWKTIRKSIDKGDAGMFQKYWQIVNNNTSIKYERSTIYDEPKDFSTERYCMYSLHFACCAYLLASKKYDLLQYVLNYSQSHPFRWHLIPERIDDIIGLFIFTKDAYNDLSYEMRFSFSEDYNLYDSRKIDFYIEQFTTLLLYCRWNRKEKDLLRHEINQKQKHYIKNLISIVQEYPDGMEWSQYLGIHELQKYKEDIILYLQSFIGEKAVCDGREKNDAKAQNNEIQVLQKAMNLSTILLLFIAILKNIIKKGRKIILGAMNN